MLGAHPPLALLFDLDGTLADSVDLILGAFRHTFATHLGRVPDDSAWIAGMGTPLAAQMRSLLDDPSLVAPMVETYRVWQREHHDLLLREFDGVRDTLAMLHARGHPMALVTSKESNVARRALRRLDLEDFVVEIVGVDSTTRHKPDPEPVRVALDRLGYAAERALFVGDSPHDMAAGNAAGVFTVAALWGPFPRSALEPAEPRRFIAHIRELPPVIDEVAARTLAVAADPAQPRGDAALQTFSGIGLSDPSTAPRRTPDDGSDDHRGHHDAG